MPPSVTSDISHPANRRNKRRSFRAAARPGAIPVEFVRMSNWQGVIPPTKASDYIPEWYKNTPMQQADNKPYGDVVGGQPTIRHCLPFIDAMTAGYIIPLWFDFAVSAQEDGRRLFQWRPYGPYQNQIEDQGGGETHPDSSEAFKFLCPWVIKTPPGVSCLVTAPFNRGRNHQLEVITGIVETDTYWHPINIPFIWLDQEFEGIMPRGMPLCQVIPFVRNTFDLQVRDSTIEDNFENNATLGDISTVFLNGYREHHWVKKEWVQ